MEHRKEDYIIKKTILLFDEAQYCVSKNLNTEDMVRLEYLGVNVPLTAHFLPRWGHLEL